MKAKQNAEKLKELTDAYLATDSVRERAKKEKQILVLVDFFYETYCKIQYEDNWAKPIFHSIIEVKRSISKKNHSYVVYVKSDDGNHIYELKKDMIDFCIKNESILESPDQEKIKDLKNAKNALLGHIIAHNAQCEKLRVNEEVKKSLKL